VAAHNSGNEAAEAIAKNTKGQRLSDKINSWMKIRGSRFLAVVWSGSTPTPSPYPVRKLSLFLSLPMCRRSSLG
jgi:hypothetical protein